MYVGALVYYYPFAAQEVGCTIYGPFFSLICIQIRFKLVLQTKKILLLYSYQNAKSVKVLTHVISL